MSLLVIFSLVLIATFVLAFIFLPEDAPIPPFKLETIKLPDHVKSPLYPHYTASGSIVFQYNNSLDNKIYVAVINDDGTNFHNIYNGEIKPFYPNTNGIRLMPFKDNKRILLGDGILECDPNIDEVTNPDTQTKIVPIEYPSEVVNMKGAFLLWSEIIISPDNIHMGWTTLSMSGSTAFISRLEKQTKTSNQQNFLNPIIDISKNKQTATDEKYIMKNVQIISDIYFAAEDPSKPGFLQFPTYIHGGEIKQFTWDGQKLTFVGSTFEGLARSVLQDLDTDSVQAISHVPGYDETTIISPDHKHGIVMSTRFSPKTSGQIFGLLPRPYSALTLMSMSQSVYSYSITGVRFYRKGNIGPALINIEESMKDSDFERNYKGYDLQPDDDFVFRSPISWHYTSSKAIWMENLRGDIDNSRIRLVVLNKDVFHPGDPIDCTMETPDNISYAFDLSVLDNLTMRIPSGKIESPLKDGGYIVYNNNNMIECSLEYVNYTYDGINYYNGSESYKMDIQTRDPTYVANVEMFNKERKLLGKMDFTVAFSGSGENLKLVREKSHGFANYNGVTGTVDEMED